MPVAVILTITHAIGSNSETVTIDDGAQRDLGAGLTLARAAASDPTGRAYTVRWFEGSELHVNDAGWWGLRVSFEPSVPAKAAQPQGLLGNFNSDPADDLIRPAGRRVPPDASPATIRSDFGDAWRISQADSLFPYASGESTATFTDRAFPTGEPQLGNTDQARAICQQAGPMSTELLTACVVDVVVTGNPVLADIAAAVARDVTIKAVAGQGQSSSTDFGAGHTVSGTVSAAQEVAHQFKANAGDVADVRSECTPSGKGFTYGIGAIDAAGSFTDPVGRVDGCTNLGRVSGQQWTFTPSAGCAHVPGFVWQVLGADGGSGGRGIYDGCQPIGPLTPTPGNYNLQIDAQTADAGYQFTVRTS